MPYNDDNHRAYLGDSVFAEVQNEMVKLTTNNGYHDDPRNEIYLEVTVLVALEAWLKRIKDAKVVLI